MNRNRKHSLSDSWELAVIKNTLNIKEGIEVSLLFNGIVLNN